MFKFLNLFLIFVTLASLVIITACDDHNVVEPRFYDEDDILEFDDCPEAPPKATAEIPDAYALGVCWVSRGEGILGIYLALPVAGDYSISIVSGSGELLDSITEFAEAGYKTILWMGTDKDGDKVDDGVYSLVVIAGSLKETIWFEIE